jgi:hypothetical protein
MKEYDSSTVKPKPLPGLLVVNRQIRDEALPIFYGTNEFRFQTCNAKYITKKLFHGVHPKHLKFINSISWTASSVLKPLHGLVTTYHPQPSWGPDPAKTYSRNLQDQAIYLASVIMLFELGLLGKCRVRMTLSSSNEPRYHVACALRALIRKQITRRGLTEAGAWNEKSMLGEDDVFGLSYAVSKEWGRSLSRVLQQGCMNFGRDQLLAPETCCPFCLPVYTLNKPLCRPYILWVKQDENTASRDGQEWWTMADEDD